MTSNGQVQDPYRLVVVSGGTSNPSSTRMLADRIAARVGALALVWACAHTDSLFGSDLVGELGLGAYRDDDWLRSARGSDGSCRYWSGDIRRRLADREPLALTSGEPPRLPGGRAVFTSV